MIRRIVLICLSTAAYGFALGCILAALAPVLWLFAVFLVVALQAITLVRPMLSPIGAERSPSGKCFFLNHFGKCALGE